MKRFFLHLAILAAIALVGGASVVFFGLYNVAASSGHLPGVSWILHTTFENSVRLRAPPMSEVPELDVPGYAALGARHYDSACKMCHAAPGEVRSDTIRKMVPVPPPIGEAVSKWEENHLYWIVRHGVKMSGMPAWPADNRDDHIWPVVAFLRQTPGMSAEDYRRLAGLDEMAEADDPLVGYCASCHGGAERGQEAQAISPAAPRLDIQTPEYLARSLKAYRDGYRFAGMMQHAASGLSDADIARLAEHFSDGGEPAELPEPSDEIRALIFGGRDRTDTAACAACHGPWPEELPAANPRLAGQHRLYLEDQLKAWRAEKRGGSDRAYLMHEAIGELDDRTIEALARFYSGAE